MKLTPSTARAVRRLALEVVLLDGETEAAPSLGDIARRAKALLDGPLRETRKPTKVSAPGRSREDRRADHREETGSLRGQVWERCGGRCEVSGVELGAAWEMHHVQGQGERRSAQRLGNVLAVSWDVHRLIHRGDLDTLRAVAACPVLDAEARQAAQRRVDKVIESRVRQFPETP